MMHAMFSPATRVPTEGVNKGEGIHYLFVLKPPDVGDLCHEFMHPLSRLVGDSLHCHLHQRTRKYPLVHLIEVAKAQELPIPVQAVKGGRRGCR
ncbi:hypothetical protein Cni_G18805 [Canna indica]|uniref:Uncharacterized protein n=1 Tax=Canna indica TaxID=4628 RepID=A0AAQ3QHX9_9LILI|nr:hypothetical protein Cni_G18805 [Canna indica]